MDDFSFEKTILVTGSGGQLGMEIWKLSGLFPSYKFLFTTKDDLPLENFEKVKSFFEEQQINYCINCAAYTAVDTAESEQEKAFLINADAAGNLGAICKAHQAQLVHISTDYVFDGTSSKPYTEEDRVFPVNVYGASKLRGEELVLNNDPSAIIIRSSWVYSSFGNNFVKTMLRLFNERENLPAGSQNINVVSDQYGCPTYAGDLALAIMTIVESNTDYVQAGIYNYCNAGVTTWYDFARSIKKIIKSTVKINPVSTASYPTRAIRPQYSVLDTTKITSTFGIKIPKWKDSLQTCLSFLT